MDLVRLVYYSRHCLGGQHPAAEQIAGTLDVSVTRNRQDDVTGGLVYDDQWFAQTLEGADRVVSNTFERILRDPRHRNVTLVNMQPIAGRRFGRWWMASARRNEGNAPLFRHFTDAERFDPLMMSTERLIDLIDGVVRDAATHEGCTAWPTRGASNAA